MTHSIEEVFVYKKYIYEIPPKKIDICTTPCPLPKLMFCSYLPQPQALNMKAALK